MRLSCQGRRHTAAVFWWVLLLVASPAGAQTTAAGQPFQRFEVAIGAGLFGGAALGGVDANLRANSLSRQPYRLFSTETRFASAPAVEGRVGIALTRRYAIEVRVSFARPELRTSIADDAEAGQTLTAVEQIDQYQVDAGLLVMLEKLRLGGVVPFASAGGGYLRQLHEGRTVVEEGRVFHAGGGVKYRLFARQVGILKAAGFRADARLYLLAGAITLDDRLRPLGALSGSLFVAF
jgi:hypothetical protein